MFRAPLGHFGQILLLMLHKLALVAHIWREEASQTSWVGPKSGGTSLPCPSFPTLNTVLNQSSSIARDGQGWCCAGFRKNSVAAPQGPPSKFCHLAPGHSSVHMLGSPRALFPMGMRHQSELITNASTSCLFWAMNNSL